MRILPPTLLAVALLWAGPACNCGDKGSGQAAEDSTATQAPRVRGDATVLEAVEQLGDQGAVVAVLRPEKWSSVHQALEPWRSKLPAEVQEALSIEDVPALLHLLGKELDVGLPSSAPPGWDPSRPIVASFGEVPYSGPPGSVTPKLPVRSWLPPARHQVWIPAKDPSALVGALAATLGAKGEAWPRLVEGRDGAKAFMTNERVAVALLPEDGAVRTVILQGVVLDDEHIEQLRPRLDATPAKPVSTPALSLLAQPDEAATMLVRTWRLRPLAAWSGATQVILAVATVANDQRSIAFSRGMQIVLDSELLMTDVGSEVDDVALSLRADEKVVRLHSVMSLTPEGRKIMDAATDDAGDAFPVKIEDAWLDAVVRIDARAALDAIEPPPYFAKTKGPGEMAEAVMEGGAFATYYMGTRHGLGMVKLLEGFAKGESLPVSIDTLPTAVHLVWQGMSGEEPVGAAAIQWPKGGSTSLAATMSSMMPVKAHTVEREGAPVTLLGYGRDPKEILDGEKTADVDALISARLSLSKLATMFPDEKEAALMHGEVLLTWRAEGAALLGELALAPPDVELATAPISVRTRGGWDSPMGDPVDEEAGTCLLEAGRSVARGLRALSTVSSDQIGVVATKALAEAEPSLQCAAANDDTAEGAAGLRRMAMELTVEVMDRNHHFGAVHSLLQSQCEASKDDRICAMEKERAALPRPGLPEIDWPMECDPDWGMPAGDFMVRMDATATAVDGAVVSDADLAARLADTVKDWASRRSSAMFPDEPPPFDYDEPTPFVPVPETKAVAELSIDGAVPMSRVRPLLKALLDAGITEVVVPVRGTRRATGAFVAKLAAEPPPLPGAGIPPAPSLGTAFGERGFYVEWAMFHVAKGMVTTRSSLRPEPQPHVDPSASILRDSKDDAESVMVYGDDTASWEEVSAAIGGGCPNAIIVLSPETP